MKVLIDAASGEILPAKRVSTRYGPRWVVNHEDGEADWYPYSPARRTTMTSKGVTEAEVDYLVRPYGRYDGFSTLFPLERPDVDSWGEAISVPAESS